MTGRSTEEWIGATPDSDIPKRVRLRLWDAANGRCAVCDRKLRASDKWQADHVVALINGGLNRESNLRICCNWCHAEKTATDVAEKSRTARIRAKHLGIKKPSTMAGSRTSNVKITMRHGPVDRTTGEPIGRPRT